MLMIGPLIDGIGGAITGAMEDLEVDSAVIEEVETALWQGFGELERSTFERLQLSGGAFGGSGPATDLSDNHGKAHRVVVDTLDGVKIDLQDFRTSVGEFARQMEHVDGTAATDMQRRQSAVEVLTTSSMHSEGDRRDREWETNPGYTGTDNGAGQGADR